MRLYQTSLRTILEIVFVVAVVLAFFYWRNVTRGTPGRYQTEYTESGGILFTDTATGEMWIGATGDRGKAWGRIQGPPIKK